MSTSWHINYTIYNATALHFSTRNNIIILAEIGAKKTGSNFLKKNLRILRKKPVLATQVRIPLEASHFYIHFWIKFLQISQNNDIYCLKKVKKPSNLIDVEKVANKYSVFPGSNRGPFDYKTKVLPLSYTGSLQ